MKAKILSAIKNFFSRLKKIPEKQIIPIAKTQKWVGEYTYGEEYPEELFGTSAGFVIKMTNTNGIIEGICIEDITEECFNCPATIQGFIEDDFISFIKTYPHFTDFDNNNVRVIKEIASAEIHYSGYLNTGGFEGVWEIEGSYVDENGELITAKSTGTWNMRKAK